MNEDKDLLRIAIAIPSLDTWHADFALSVIGVIVDLKKEPIEGYKRVGVSVSNIRSSSIAKQRHDLVEEARANQCDYIFFADSDQTFPPETIRRLIASGKDVIGCNIAVKRLPSLPTARKYVEKYPLTGDVVYTTPESTGIEEIWKLGFGIMLIKMSVFDQLDMPYFNFDWNPTTGYVGEDWWFCEQLKKKGIPLYIDHDLSKKIGHAGQYIFGHKDVDHTEQKIRIVRPDDPDAETTQDNGINEPAGA